MTSQHSQRGQASVEFVAVLPLMAVVAMLAWQAVIAGQAVWLSGSAARAAARAAAIGRDPLAAARSVLPHSLRAGVRVRALRDGSVRVRMAVPFAGATSHAVGTITTNARFEPQR